MREQLFIRHRDRFGSWSYTPVDQSDAKKTTDFAARIAELNQGATAVAFLRRNGELFGLDAQGCAVAPERAAIFGQALDGKGRESLERLLCL